MFKHWTWSREDGGSCGIRSFNNPSWIVIPPFGRTDLASGVKYGNAVRYGRLPVYKLKDAKTQDQCLKVCRDDGKCQSVSLTANLCVLNDFGNEEGKLLEGVRNSFYAVVSDCCSEMKPPKSGAYITAPYTYGNYDFEYCKNSCRNSNQCKVRMLLNSPSLVSHYENFFSIFLGSNHVCFVAITDTKGHGPTFLALTLALKQACFRQPVEMEFIMVLGITGSDPTKAARKVAKKLVSPNVRPIANAKASILSKESAC